MVRSVSEAQTPLTLRALRLLTKVLYRFNGTGLPRVAEYVRRSVASRLIASKRDADYWILDFMGQARFKCDLRDHMGSQIFFRGAYSLDQLRLIERLFEAPFTFVDVGANQGEFSVFVASMSEDNRVLAFEPTQNMRSRLQHNLSCNELTNAKVFGFGLSDRSRDNVPIYGSDDVMDDGTFHAGLPTIHTMTDRHVRLESISLRSLDETLQNNDVDSIDLIKIDVEGEELSVLKGAQNTISQFRPFLILEANSTSAAAAGYTISELYGWLENQGYLLKEISPGGHCIDLRPDIPFSNVIGVPDEKATSALPRLG